MVVFTDCISAVGSAIIHVLSLVSTLCLQPTDLYLDFFVWVQVMTIADHRKLIVKVNGRS